MDLIKHQDIAILTMRIKSPNHHIPREFNVMNVYNNANNRALGVLERMEDRLPLISICVGDFNIQDPEWDPTTTNQHGRNAIWLKDLTSHMELSYTVLENHPTPTHIPDQDSQRPLIIDLVFTPFNLTDEGGLKVTVINKESMHFTSDHNMVRINIPFTNEFPRSKGRILEE
jgi:hypothetical protein